MKNDPIRDALENVADAAKALACHGYEGYTTDTSALDVVFIRSLQKLKLAMQEDCDRIEFYDPEGDVYASLPKCFGE